MIIPNYKESEHELARTLDSLAAQANADQLVVVLAMEERETGAQRKATRLILAYRGRFGDMFATYHPTGIPGETPGKGSNEAWAAREAHVAPDEAGGDDIARYTVTELRRRRRLRPAPLRGAELPVPDRQRPLPHLLAAGDLQQQQHLGHPRAAAPPRRPLRDQPPGEPRPAREREVPDLLLLAELADAAPRSTTGTRK